MIQIKYLVSILLMVSTIALAQNSNLIIEETPSINQELQQAFRTKRSFLLKNISHKNFLRNFYYKNGYTPLWITNSGLNQVKTNRLFSYINNDLTLSKHGAIYKHSQDLSKQLEKELSASELFRMEIKLTALYYDFLEHTLYGGIQWKSFTSKLASLKRYKINASWIRYKAPYNISNLLLQPDIDVTMAEITPNRFGYNELLFALKKLHTIKAQGGWKPLPYFKRLELGSKGDMVVKLRQRLSASQDYSSCAQEPVDYYGTNSEENQSINTPHIEEEALFDSCLEKAVKKFQKRHGLVVDGIVGGGTRKILNIDVDQKIETVLLNIDRIKWLPRNYDERYIVVNLPEFMLHYIEDEQEKQQLRVIIGDTKHPTPVFAHKIEYIVLNPYWKVPEGIVKREIVPAMVKNRNYLKKQGLEAHRTWDENSAVVNVRGLNWSSYLYGKAKFPYRLMQPPGPKNALGKIKFKFPNQFAVYLHDTPTKHLFKRNVRAFSHGCVRLSEPVSLLDTIAGFNPSIDLKQAKKTLEGKRKTQLNVENQLPIYLVYLTAGVGDEDELQFRNDIYRYDKFTKRIHK